MTDAVKMAIEALDKCRAQFQFYADEHTSAGKLEKAATNQRFAAMAALALEQAGEPVDAVLLDRAELAWQRFFYPAADCFAGPAADKLPSADLEVADCLRLVLAAVGRLVVTPETDVPAPLPTLDAGEARRIALIERLGTFGDLLSSDPLDGEKGDVAYELIRQAAAQISSDRQRLSALSSAKRGEADHGR